MPGWKETPPVSRCGVIDGADDARVGQGVRPSSHEDQRGGEPGRCSRGVKCSPAVFVVDSANRG